MFHEVGSGPATELATEFNVLGPLEVRRGGRAVPRGTPKVRAVLSVLLSRAGRTVPVDAIHEALWRDAPPRSAAKNVHGYVHALRHTILDDPGRIERHGAAYRLVVHPGELDADRFEALVREGRTANDPEEAASLFRTALDLWRGPDAYDDVPETPPTHLDARRLAEMRLGALLDWADAELRLGRAGDLAPRLLELTAEHPLNEELWARLMSALHACGRTAEALAAFEDARRALAEEAGLLPGPRLRLLRQRIASSSRPARGRRRMDALRTAEEARAAASALLVPVRLDPIGDSFRGGISAVHAGPLVVGRLRCTPHTVSRPPRTISSTDRDLVKVVLNRSPSGITVGQDGRECRVGPGELVVCDMTRPYSITVPGPCDVTFLGVPRALLGDRADVLARRTAVRLPSDAGLTSLITTCLAGVSDRVGALPDPAGRHLGDALTSLVLAALTATAPARTETPTDLADRILAYASANLHDPSLSVESAATRHGISPRRLHELFRDRDHTFMRWVRRERLARIRRDLRDPALAHRSVASVAARWGILDAAHVSRALKAEYGQTAAEIRQSA
ncbi:BTAD domain-containing putative transcriptional regulator [Actinomadura rupiterrae]|uniref:BTAD domain-containing putative transcriptional regulator n=1 Tax=Actinomadura rupiterrae TaxID=559627 RepID=UPI0020A53FB3|nr:BTAD domain-containing putative transcriptional regulator [Actinomadura rupiterrae]MCP2337739.1 DNA-binding SARP family transcriptional activator/AraC-like DNA-binding protein [Actinomadura rupiterrae]